MKKTIIILILLVIVVAAGWAANFAWKNFRGIGPALREPPEKITEVINTTGMPLKLPPGFSIEIFAKDLPGARVMARFSDRHMWVSQTGEGKISELIIK